MSFDIMVEEIRGECREEDLVDVKVVSISLYVLRSQSKSVGIPVIGGRERDNECKMKKKGRKKKRRLRMMPGISLQRAPTQQGQQHSFTNNNNNNRIRSSLPIALDLLFCVNKLHQKIYFSFH